MKNRQLLGQTLTITGAPALFVNRSGESKPAQMTFGADAAAARANTPVKVDAAWPQLPVGTLASDPALAQLMFNS